MTIPHGWPRTLADAIEVDRVVCRAVRKRPGESIEAAARRIMSAPHGDRAWRVARELLVPNRSPWVRMCRAAKVARRCGLA